MLFAEGVPNAAAAQLSLMLGLRGACQTIIGTETAGLDALRLSTSRLASGAIDRLIVCAGEESHFTLDEAYACCADGRPRGAFQSIACAVAFVLENKQAAASRGARSLGSIDRATSRFGDERTEHGDLPPVLLAGSAFSAGPLLSLAAELLHAQSTATFDVALTDRNRFGTRLTVSRYA